MPNNDYMSLEDMTAAVPTTTDTRGAQFDADATVRLLAEILRDTPRLGGGLCRGRSVLFDPPEQGQQLDHPDVAYRHDIARSICKQCEDFDACTNWVASLPVSKRPAGVVAGGVFTVDRKNTGSGRKSVA